MEAIEVHTSSMESVQCLQIRTSDHGVGREKAGGKARSDQRSRERMKTA